MFPSKKFNSVQKIYAKAQGHSHLLFSIFSQMNSRLKNHSTKFECFPKTLSRHHFGVLFLALALLTSGATASAGGCSNLFQGVNFPGGTGAFISWLNVSPIAQSNKAKLFENKGAILLDSIRVAIVMAVGERTIHTSNRTILAKSVGYELFMNRKDRQIRFAGDPVEFRIGDRRTQVTTINQFLSVVSQLNQRQRSFIADQIAQVILSSYRSAKGLRVYPASAAANDGQPASPPAEVLGGGESFPAAWRPGSPAMMDFDSSSSGTAFSESRGGGGQAVYQDPGNQYDSNPSTFGSGSSRGFGSAP